MERLNQTLNFETSDCKITGGCDIFTTKPVASDKKLYKTIDHHLESLLQENESYNAALQQALIDSSGSLSPSLPDSNSRDYNSFWEQKRRMSVNEKSNGNGYASNGNGQHSRSNKLNDQNLKELVSNSDSGYLSSSSTESASRIRGKIRRTSSNNSLQGNRSSFTRRRSSAYDSSITIGPFGPINETASRRTFAYLIAILNASYPDHDFSSLEPTDFIKVSLKTMISKFENSLYSLGKQPEEWMWEVINSHMDISDCVIYQYSPSRSFMDDEPGHLWSLKWFLFNKKRKRVAYLYLTSSRLKSTSNSEINEDDEKEAARARYKRKFTIGEDMNQYEGEYDLTYDENAIEDDEEDAIGNDK